jgi:hypothetical protein
MFLARRRDGQACTHLACRANPEVPERSVFATPEAVVALCVGHGVRLVVHDMDGSPPSCTSDRQKEAVKVPQRCALRSRCHADPSNATVAWDQFKSWIERGRECANGEATLADTRVGECADVDARRCGGASRAESASPTRACLARARVTPCDRANRGSPDIAREGPVGRDRDLPAPRRRGVREDYLAPSRRPAG